MIKSLLLRLWRHFRGDSLFRNSVYLMISSGVVAALGFIFWILVARIFPTKDVGIATTLLSAAALLSNFSLLGYNTSLIRYLPKSQLRNEKINSVLLLVFSASIAASFIFISGLHIFSPKLGFLQKNLLYIVTFTVFVIGLSASTIFDSIFVAYRSAVNVLIKSSILSVLKLLLPLFLVFLGSYGIFASIGLATIISSIVGFVILIYRFQYQPAINFNAGVIREMAIFSGGNFIASFLSKVPTLVLPLLIINKFKPEIAAYFYMDMMILSFLIIISDSTTQSLLAEGSYEETKLVSYFLKAAQFIFLFLIPAIVVIFLFGNLILNAFGKDYASSAFTLLRIISISAIFISISSLATSILRIRHQMKALININIIGVLLILGLSYSLIGNGLMGIGFAWLLGQAGLSIIYIIFLGKSYLFKKAELSA